MKDEQPLPTCAEQKDRGVWDPAVPPEENHYFWRGEPKVRKANATAKEGPTIAELFCGCGGTSLGFELAGFRVAVGVDIHAPSVSTFQHNHPRAATILGDIKKITPQQITAAMGRAKPDVLVAGVPCQGFSLNNRKRSAADSRNFLYREFIKFVQELQPRAVVLENVSGMRSAEGFVHAIERDLSSASGMRVRSALLNAQDYGVPQKRQRLIFVGVVGSDFDFAAIRPTHGPGTSKPYLTVGDAIGDLPSLMPGETKTSYARRPQNEYQKLMRGNAARDALTNHSAPNHPEETIDRIARTIPGEPMYSEFKQRIRLHWNAPSPTQVSGGIRPQFQFGHPVDPRGLSIRERCRIQSFPDSFFVLGGIVQGRVQTGNAVPPFLAKAIALALREYV